MVRRKPEPREQAKPVRPERAGPTEPPPTIAAPKTISLTGIHVTCPRANCRRSKPMTWEQLALPDDLLFPRVVEKKRFACSACNGKAVNITPDWRQYRPQGGGQPSLK